MVGVVLLAAFVVLMPGLVDSAGAGTDKPQRSAYQARGGDTRAIIDIPMNTLSEGGNTRAIIDIPSNNARSIIEIPHNNAREPAKVLSVKGDADKLIVPAGKAKWAPLKAGDVLGACCVVRTGLRSSVQLVLADGSRATVGSATKMGIENVANTKAGATQLVLKYGSIKVNRNRANKAPRSQLVVQTPAGAVKLTKGKGSIAYQSGRLALVGKAGTWEAAQRGTRARALAGQAARGGRHRALAGGGSSASRIEPGAMSVVRSVSGMAGVPIAGSTSGGSTGRRTAAAGTGAKRPRASVSGLAGRR